jgi:hypothetical protein
MAGHNLIGKSAIDERLDLAGDEGSAASGQQAAQLDHRPPAVDGGAPRMMNAAKASEPGSETYHLAKALVST